MQSLGCVINTQGQHISSKRQMGEQGSKHSRHERPGCDQPAWGCGHVPSQAGQDRFIPQQGSALCLAGPGRLSQGHIPVPWVMAAPLDVVLKKLPSGSVTKRNPREQSEALAPLKPMGFLPPEISVMG